jgi:hypothetical protein
MSYSLQPYQRLLVLTKQIPFKSMPTDLAFDLLQITIGAADDTAWQRPDKAAEILDLVERIEARTGVSSFFEGIIIDGPTWSTPSEVPTSEPEWSQSVSPPA